MKTLAMLTVCALAGIQLSLAQMKAVDVKGDVRVRHGVDRDWEPIRSGRDLKPEDTMMLGKRAHASVLLDGNKRVLIPENTVVDLLDFRVLSHQDLLLRLAMERIRAVPAQNDGNLEVPQTTVSHGAEQPQPPEEARSLEFGRLQLNGTRVLYKNGFYGTCAVKTKEILRLYPELSHDTGLRLMIAAALEKENLHGEALTEYASLAKDDLSPRDRSFVNERMKKLRK